MLDDVGFRAAVIEFEPSATSFALFATAFEPSAIEPAAFADDVLPNATERWPVATFALPLKLNIVAAIAAGVATGLLLDRAFRNPATERA